MTDWITLWKHEDARQAAQRAASADRKATAMELGKQAVGTYAAVADLLGITAAAVSDARANARNRAAAPVMADYIDLDLPRAGATVPLPAEWDAVPADQRQATAERAAATWAAIAAVCRHLSRQTRAAAETIAEALVIDDEWDGPLQLAEQVAAALPGWPPAGDEAGHHAMATVLGDLAGALDRHAAAADRQHRQWQHRAGDDYAGETAAL